MNIKIKILEEIVNTYFEVDIRTVFKQKKPALKPNNRHAMVIFISIANNKIGATYKAIAQEYNKPLDTISSIYNRNKDMIDGRYGELKKDYDNILNEFLRVIYGINNVSIINGILEEINQVNREIEEKTRRIVFLSNKINKIVKNG